MWGICIFLPRSFSVYFWKAAPGGDGKGSTPEKEGSNGLWLYFSCGSLHDSISSKEVFILAVVACMTVYEAKKSPA
jgi:hypothetical protein